MQAWDKATRRLMALGRWLQDFRFPTLAPRDPTCARMLHKVISRGLDPWRWRRGPSSLEAGSFMDGSLPALFFLWESVTKLPLSVRTRPVSKAADARVLVGGGGWGVLREGGKQSSPLFIADSSPDSTGVSLGFVSSITSWLCNRGQVT